METPKQVLRWNWPLCQSEVYDRHLLFEVPKRHFPNLNLFGLGMLRCLQARKVVFVSSAKEYWLLWRQGITHKSLLEDLGQLYQGPQVLIWSLWYRSPRFWLWTNAVERTWSEFEVLEDWVLERREFLLLFEVPHRVGPRNRQSRWRTVFAVFLGDQKRSDWLPGRD